MNRKSFSDKFVGKQKDKLVSSLERESFSETEKITKLCSSDVRELFDSTYLLHFL
jgi:hypothetical protein